MALTNRQLIALADACLHATARCETLSAFEFETLGEISERVLAFGREAVITDAEWQLIEDVTAALAANGRTLDGRGRVLERAA